ncbi:MAG: MATE family efflux transporter [Lachnospiraceae bacterium]|nr:MATE family efflux transporter [Lachnospiraceae bacterium]
MTDNNFTEGRILSKLFKFMIPILGALVLQAMYGAVDILIVGQFGTTAGISAVSTGSNIVNLLVFTVTGLAMGITIVIGMYLGQKKEKRIGKLLGGAICFFVAVSVVLSVIMLIFARPLAMLMQAPAEALDLTVTYVRICGGGMIFVVGYNVISSVFRGLGNSRLPLIFVAIACVVNIFGDLFFVAVLGMNVAGAAVATILAQAVSVVLSIMIIRKQELPFTLTKQDIRFNSEIFNFVRVGAPIALQEILTQLSFLALCAFINRLGLEASSGYGVANKIVAFVMLIPSSLMQSISAFVAQNVGAGKEKRARDTMLCGMTMGICIGALVCIGVFLKGDIPSALFTQDEAVIVRAFEYLRGFAPEAVVTAILFSFIGYYNGHGQTLFVMIQGLAQTFLVRLPMSWYMSIQPDASLTNIGLAAPSATVFGILINGLYFLYYSRKVNGKK